MLKREITYENFDEEEVTGVFYFNISKPELIELEVEKQGGFSNWLKKIFEAKDNKTIIEQFKRIILLAYGEKSDDGNRFIKSDELRTAFSQTAAFEALFMELAMDEGAAAAFIIGSMPKDMRAQIQEAQAKEAKLAVVPPVTPPTTSQ